ncbi:MAG TPA: hypothetical protein VNT42_12120 [Sphingomonas sp.]|nr:hypothetical protein [Sphingomonas sp.]
MQTVARRMLLIVAGAATPTQSAVRTIDAAAELWPVPSLLARVATADPVRRYDGRSHIRFGHVSPIRTVAGGIDASPFVTALPGNMWRGRLRSFGTVDGAGFSGIAVRARSIGSSGFRSERYVSGFLASELRYGVKLDGDDVLTVDLNAASQRLPVALTIGRGKSVHVTSFYVGATFVHDRRFSLTGGMYRLSVSMLSPLDYAVERSAGMPAAGQGLGLGFYWRLEPEDTITPARIGFDLRDGDADRDRSLALVPHPDVGRERRILLRFTSPF